MNLRDRKLVRTVQILFGLYLLFFGVIGYIVTLPIPSYNEAGLAFLGALFATGYVFHLISIIFVLSGVMFIFNKWSAFGAILLAPVTVNIVLFHVFLDFMGWWMALIFVILHVYLLAVHWLRYKPMFSK